MQSLGARRRLTRLQGPRGRVLLLAADHGLPAGPIRGLEEPASLFATLPSPPVTGIILNPGLVRCVPPDAACPLIVHLSASTRLGRAPTSKVLASSVLHAARLGAEVVSVQIHFGDPQEDRMLADAGSIVDAADGLGLPVLMMAYPPGATEGVADLLTTRHAARAAAELGADLVQVPHLGSVEDVRSVVRTCPAPLLVAGGPRSESSDAFLEAVAAAVAGGVEGIVVGRNLFQHPTPAAFAHRIGQVLFSDAPQVELMGA